MKAFKYRLYPSKEQQSKLWMHANKLNSLYNYFLNERIEFYKKEKKFISKFDQIKELPKLKEKDTSLSEINAQVLQQVPSRLDRSYQDFFRRIKNKESKKGFPNFRPCKKFFGICYPQSANAIKENIFHTKVYGDIKFIKHRQIQGNIKTIYITCKSNKWYISITTDYIKPPKEAKGMIGIDIGLKSLVVTSEGDKIKNRTDSKYYDKVIAKVQSLKDKKKKGSKRSKYLGKVIGRLYDAKVNKVNDYQHKISKRLSLKYDTIFAEDLSVKSMSEGKYSNLNKALRNARLAEFIRFLSYKTNRLILVNPRNTSKMCNHCKHIKDDLKLSDREITCSNCGMIYDRDINAAKNVYCLGQAIISNNTNDECG